MKKVIYVLFLTLLSLNVFAQEVNDSNNSKLSLNFNVASTYKVPQGETGDWRYSFSLYAQLELNNRFSFNTGLSYDVLHEHSNLILNFGNSILHRKTEEYFSFLNIPILFRYQLFGKTKLIPFIELGLQGSILTENKFTAKDELSFTEHRHFNNGSISFHYGLGTGVIYNRNSKLDYIFTINHYRMFIPLQWEYKNLLNEVVVEEVFLYYSKVNFGIIYHF